MLVFAIPAIAVPVMAKWEGNKTISDNSVTVGESVRKEDNKILYLDYESGMTQAAYFGTYSTNSWDDYGEVGYYETDVSPEPGLLFNGALHVKKTKQTTYQFFLQFESPSVTDLTDYDSIYFWVMQLAGQPSTVGHGAPGEGNREYWTHKANVSQLNSWVYVEIPVSEIEEHGGIKNFYIGIAGSAQSNWEIVNGMEFLITPVYAKPENQTIEDLLALYHTESVPDKVAYFDSGIGLRQISCTGTTAVAIDTASYTLDETEYSGSLQLTAAANQWQIYVHITLPGATEIKNGIVFYVKTDESNVNIRPAAKVGKEENWNSSIGYTDISSEWTKISVTKSALDEKGITCENLVLMMAGNSGAFVSGSNIYISPVFIF